MHALYELIEHQQWQAAHDLLLSLPDNEAADQIFNHADSTLTLPQDG